MVSEKQHFVPESYLKNFASPSFETYSSHYISEQKKWTTPKKYNTRAICYIRDFYDIPETLIGKLASNKKEIEKNAFWYEKEYINHIVQKAKKNNFSKDDMEGLSRFLLSLKQRNPKFRDGYSIERIKENLIEIKAHLFKEIQSRNLKITEKEINQMIDLEAEKICNTPEINKDLHLKSILKNSNKKNLPFESKINQLIHFQIRVLEPQNNNTKFLTTDNPGYSVDYNGKSYSAYFQEDTQYHFLPISSQLGLIFLNQHLTPYNTLDEKVLVSKEDIFKLNFHSVIHRNKYIYCNDSKYLKCFLNKINTPTST